MARRKVKRYNGEDGSDVSDDQTFTPKRVNLNNPGSYSMPMPVSQDQAAFNAGNQGLADAYMNQMPAPSVPTDIGPQAPITQVNAPIPTRNRIVSKKELAESGYDNLRDFLNAEKGLKRKGETEARKPSKTETKAPSKSVVTKEVKQSEWEDNTPLPTMRKSGKELLLSLIHI